MDGFILTPAPERSKTALVRRLPFLQPENGASFPHADTVGLFTVFNFDGNQYRLVFVIRYRWQVVYIRDILTHAEYDQGKRRSPANLWWPC